MGWPAHFLNHGIHIGGRSVAFGSIPESVPTLSTDGFDVVRTLSSGIAVSPPAVLALVDFEGGTDPTATLQVYGYYPEETDLLTPWQLLQEIDVNTIDSLHVLQAGLGAKRLCVIVSAVTGSPTSVRLAFRAVAASLLSTGDGGGSPSPIPSDLTQDANCTASDNAGDLIYITGPDIGGKPQVARADATANSKMPVVGMIVSKSSATECVIRSLGETSLLSGLTPGKYYFVTATGGVALTPPAGPGTRYAQTVGVALSTNKFWVQPQYMIYTLV